MPNLFLSTCLFLFVLSSCVEVAPPAPYGPVPTEAQMEWQKMEYYMFIHFGPNTFTNVEWGSGSEDPKVFNPTGLDCRQWASIAKNAGMKGIIITAKHHDGFCLWPSKYSTHTVRESEWKQGRGDVLRELSEACKEYGLKFGVYLSPWDRNHPFYGTPEYNQVFDNTLSEVYENYGGEEIFEQWFDGANGEGANGKKQEYDWKLFHRTIYKYNPALVVFSDIGPGCRWMGNERGVAGETNWSTLNVKGFGKGKDAPAASVLNTGNKNGEAWVPAETDVSIRPGWFYSPDTDDKVKSAERLVDIYYTSIGRNSNLLLNVPPDRRGLIHPNDSARLMDFRERIEEIFKNNLAAGAKVKASQVRGNSSKYAASNVLNGEYDSYWAVEDSIFTPSIEIEFDKERTFNRLLLQEYIPLGQRIAKFSVDYRDTKTGEWKRLAEGTTIGYKRILCFPVITTGKLKINIEEALACPVINNISVHNAPERLSAPTVKRSKTGMVSIRCNTQDPIIYYTLDGSEPSIKSQRYEGEFDLSKGGKVRAVATIEQGKRQSEVVTVDFGLAPIGWKVLSLKDEKAAYMIDGNAGTSFNIPSGASFIVDLNASVLLKGFSYTPLKIGANHLVKYDLDGSIDGKQWIKLKRNGVFNNIKNNPVAQDVFFDKEREVRFLRLTPIETIVSGEAYTVAEFGVFVGF